MLVNSSVAGSPYPRITPRAILALSGALYRQERVHDDLAQVLLSATAAQELRQQFAKAWRTIDVATGVPLANIAKQLMAAKRFRAADETKAIVAPVSIIKCLGDNFVDPRCSDWIHKLIPAAAVIEHPTAGHELAYEDPAWFCQQIKNYTLAILA